MQKWPTARRRLGVQYSEQLGSARGRAAHFATTALIVTARQATRGEVRPARRLLPVAQPPSQRFLYLRMSGHSATARRARARGPSSTALLLLCTLARAQDFDDDFGDDSQGYLYPSPPPPPSVGSVGSSSSCIFTAPLGERFDLTPMARTDHDYTGATTGGYTYRFNVCGNTNRLCNAQPAPAAKWRGTKCNNLGDSSTQTVSLLDGRDPSKGLKLTYTNGDICKRQIDGQMEIGSRLVSYEVYCNAGEEGKLRHINEVSMCEYVILFDSRHACPSGGPNGGPLHGRGWRLIFFMLFCALTYLGVGSACPPSAARRPPTARATARARPDPERRMLPVHSLSLSQRSQRGEARRGGDSAHPVLGGGTGAGARRLAVLVRAWQGLLRDCPREGQGRV